MTSLLTDEQCWGPSIASVTVCQNWRQLPTWLYWTIQSEKKKSGSVHTSVFYPITVTDKEGKHIVNITSSIFQMRYCLISSNWKTPSITICKVLTEATTKISVADITKAFNESTSPWKPNNHAAFHRKKNDSNLLYRPLFSFMWNAVVETNVVE